MPIESSGAISLGTTAGTNRSISGELGGTQPHSLSEYYRDGSYSDGITIPANETSIPASGEIKFSNFYGVSGAESGSLASTWFTGTGFPFVPQPRVGVWGHKNYTNASSAQVGASVGFFNDQPNDRIALRDSTFDSSAAQTFNYTYVAYTGYATETFRAKCQYSVNASTIFTASAENPASYSPATNTYANISTSSYSPLWQWSVTANSGTETGTLSASTGTSASSDRPYWTIANSVETDTLSGPETTFSGTTTYGNSVSLTATRGTTGGPGGPGGGGGGPEVCIHEDMLVSTQNGEQSIHDIKEGSPKIWAWNNETSTRELVDLLAIIIINHENLYTVNNLKLTEDHPVYLKDYTVASVNPSKTLENYEVSAAQLAIGDEMMKEDGTLETITSIEVLSGEHVTYTLKTELSNFYANNYLVDSEI
jgi:hypothetical protein